MNSLLRKLLAWKSVWGERAKVPTDPFQAARDNQLNKGGKVDLAERAVFLNHTRQIAHDDVDAVRRWKKANLKGFEDVGSSKGEDDTGIVICDDYHHNDPTPPPPPSRAWPMALGLVLGGSLIAGAVALPTILDRLKPQEQRPQPNANTTIEKTSGFILDLPGAGKQGDGK